MLVRDLLHKIETKEMTVQELADHYKYTKITIQNKIKKLGYRWDNKSARYEYIGDNQELLDVDFNTLFDAVNTKVSSKPLENKISSIDKQLDSETKPSYEMKKGKMDVVDLLLNKNQKTKRVYRGFYFD